MSPLLAIIIILILTYLFISHIPHRDLIVQIPNEDDIESLREHLCNQGIPTYSKNMSSQGLIARRGGPLGEPSLHVVHQKDLSRAIELAKKYLEQ